MQQFKLLITDSRNFAANGSRPATTLARVGSLPCDVQAQITAAIPRGASYDPQARLETADGKPAPAPAAGTEVEVKGVKTYAYMKRVNRAAEGEDADWQNDGAVVSPVFVI